MALLPLTECGVFASGSAVNTAPEMSCGLSGRVLPEGRSFVSGGSARCCGWVTSRGHRQLVPGGRVAGCWERENSSAVCPV